MFDGEVHIYAEDFIEVSELPARGVIARYHCYNSDDPGGTFSSLPAGGSPGCVAYGVIPPREEWDSEDGGCVDAEPLISFERKPDGAGAGGRRRS
jgi:hypothetical protein